VQPSERSPILYDADCGFCRWSLGVILAWDRRRRLRPVALQDAEAGRLLAGMPRAEQMRSFHVVERDGRVHSAGAAVGPLGRRLPGGAPLVAVAAALPGVAERVYRLIADHRGSLGRPLSPRARARADARIESRR
jgi:predicted DCC family thiol-disulfide oxidoreductase YuxK